MDRSSYLGKKMALTSGGKETKVRKRDIARDALMVWEASEEER